VVFEIGHSQVDFIPFLRGIRYQGRASWSYVKKREKNKVRGRKNPPFPIYLAIQEDLAEKEAETQGSQLFDLTKFYCEREPTADRGRPGHGKGPVGVKPFASNVSDPGRKRPGTLGILRLLWIKRGKARG